MEDLTLPTTNRNAHAVNERVKADQRFAYGDQQPGIHLGNAVTDRMPFRQWFVGPFVQEPASPRHTNNVEVKWGCHHQGETRAEWAAGEDKTTLSILIRGRFRLTLKSSKTSSECRTYVLNKESDYLIWSPEFDHTWTAEEESVVLTVRWKSSDTGFKARDPAE